MKHRVRERDPEAIKEQKLICKRIMKIRLMQKRTRIDVAIGADMNPNYYGRVERGMTGVMGMRMLCKIRESLGVKWKDIFGSENAILVLLQGTDEDSEEKYYNGN